MAPAGATVTESQMISSALTGDPREADVTIAYEVAGVPVTVFVECRDHARPADVTWIDQLIGKYIRKSGKVVAVSSSGFTQKALEAAIAVGISTMTISEATDTNWITWINNIDRMWVTFVFHALYGVTSVNLIDKSIKPTDYPAMRPSELMFSQADGTSVGTAIDIYDRVVVDDPTFNVDFEQLERTADGRRNFGLRLAPGVFVEMPDGRRLAVEGIVYIIDETVETIEVPLKPGEYAARSIATGSGQGKEWKVKIVYVKEDGAEPRWSLNVRRVDDKKLAGRLELFGYDPLRP